ncbi:hypothetical protein CTI12_AA328150 [Artemisia annua]|uniref:Uncharacterized protein n=1 Tax=Artemisia annua TaxID=35608 RepID=A0A2U1MYI7_ARTAN|nr:hypothetical protein CTI12_AA328150 [Artemisia annua]
MAALRIKGLKRCNMIVWVNGTKSPVSLNDYVVSSLSSKGSDKVLETTTKDARVIESGETSESRVNAVNKEGVAKGSISVDKDVNCDLPELPVNTVSNTVDSEKLNNVEICVNNVNNSLNDKTDGGSEVVVFDEMIVLKGSERWNLTVCGQFVGYSMNPNESKILCAMMKGPWMINNKPLFVQKWSPEMNMKKIEPRKLPVWVKMVNIPLEAWSVDGLSALASSVGVPILMDNMTATICHKGMGNMGYARVLVEVLAEKSLKENIEIQYKDKENNVKGTKSVKVMYDWKPPVCEHCKVFGHDMLHCTVRPKNADEIEREKNEKAKEVMGNHVGRNAEDRSEGGVQGRRVNNRYQGNTYRMLLHKRMQV